jgi:hypothetical protein
VPDRFDRQFHIERRAVREMRPIDRRERDHLLQDR